jgi:hypothetical protein
MGHRNLLTKEGYALNRMVAIAIFMVCLATFSQSAGTQNKQTSGSSDAAKKPAPTFSFADIFTNVRLKFRSGMRCASIADLSGKDSAADTVKLAAKKTCPIDGNEAYRVASGIWKGEGSDSDLMSPEQISITCWADEKSCSVMTISLDVDKLGISIKGPDETDYRIDSWDTEGLVAIHDPNMTDTCHRSILSMSFAAGEVSLSDIPTHAKGCEIFKETNSYRLVDGQYYVDTTPKNDSPEVTTGNK